jgi:tetratricopeptide (TPR) repeat protein/TolB-like protein
MTRWTALLLGLGLAGAAGVPDAGAAVKRAVLVVPFDVTAAGREDTWAGDGVAELLRLALVHHPSIVQIDRARVRGLFNGDDRSEADVVKVARAVHADAAFFGEIRREGETLVIRPRYADLKGSAAEPVSLAEVPVPNGEFLARLPRLPVLYARALKLPVSDAEGKRMEAAMRPTSSLKALQLYVNARIAMLKNTSEGHDAATDLLARAIDLDSTFVVAQYSLGLAHQALGNRWKAAAQFRACTQLDPAFPESYKALGDLFLAAPRRLFDQAVEAYTKAIELRPYYSDAYAGLGDARAAKGDVDGAVAAYTSALTHNPVNARMHASLAKVYFTEKGLYYEAVSAYKRAVELDPDLVEARMGLGEIYEEKGLYKEAIAEYKRAVELDDKHTGAHYNLAAVYEHVDPGEAITLWERYIELAAPIPAEKDWVEIARQHIRKLKSQLK